jgi:hypothetical protein
VWYGICLMVTRRIIFMVQELTQPDGSGSIVERSSIGINRKPKDSEALQRIHLLWKAEVALSFETSVNIYRTYIVTSQKTVTNIACLLACQPVIRFKYGHIITPLRVEGKIMIGVLPNQSFANVTNFKYFETSNKWNDVREEIRNTLNSMNTSCHAK